MGKYPSKDGIAVSPYELGFSRPTPEQLEANRRVEYHHAHYFGRYYNPESDGYGEWRQIFRNMVQNVYPLLIEEHNGNPKSLHGMYSPPKVPTDTIMIGFIEEEIEESGIIALHNPRRIQPPRFITPDQWEIKKRRYTNRRKA